MEKEFAFELSFNLVETVGLSILVLLIGRFFVQKIGVLNKFCIPAPVVGGLLFALVNFAAYTSGAFSVTLDTTLQSFFMICFFTTIGFGASASVLKKGGVGVLLFLILASVLCIFQNAIGVGVSMAFGENPLLGIATGSVPMTGGHGTAGAFGPLLEEAGLVGGATIAVAAATFGLISGSLIGGPTGRRLIVSKGLKSNDGVSKDLDIDAVLDEKAIVLDSAHLSNAFFQIGIAIGVGSYVSKLIALTGLTVPAYIGSMLVAAVMRNVFTEKSAWEIRFKEIQALGDIFLAVFLAQALMSMKFWELADLALPLIVILCIQVAFMWAFANFITFKVMGSDYDAAVLAAGHCGFGLGATPNGVANMSAVVGKFGPSTKAFFILPIVGGLFIDFTNALIITGFINFFV